MGFVCFWVPENNRRIELDACFLMPKHNRVFELEFVIFGARAGGNDEVGFGCCLVLTY